MDHRNIARFELCSFVADDSENAMSVIAHPKEGEPFMISFPVATGADIAQRLTEALQQIAKELQGSVSANVSPEGLVRYGVIPRKSDQDHPIELLIEGDRQRSPFLVALTRTDARRMGAMLMAEAEAASSA